MNDRDEGLTERQRREVEYHKGHADHHKDLLIELLRK